MTNKEAIERLKWVQKRISDITYSPESFEAIDVAIKTLEERQQGEWTNTSPYDDKGECPLCCYLSKKYYKFCPYCGASMKKGGKEE